MMQCSTPKGPITLSFPFGLTLTDIDEAEAVVKLQFKTMRRYAKRNDRHEAGETEYASWFDGDGAQGGGQ